MEETMRSLMLLVFIFITPLIVTGTTYYVPDDYTSIQAAINAVSAGDVVIVRDGTYNENINFNGAAITIISESGPHKAIIDGNQLGSVVSFINSELVTSVLEGFTITNGNGTDVGGELLGGGIICGPTSSPTLRGNIIKCNTADYGGGICAYDYSSPTIENNFISGNKATLNGGGMRAADNSKILMKNNVFDWNRAKTGGGFELYKKSGGTFSNLTVVNNVATDKGGGISVDNWSNVNFINTILWDNIALSYSDPQITINFYSYVYIDYSNVMGGHTGTGNIDTDPLFKDLFNCDYHLNQDPCQPGITNPCVDSGSATASSLGMDTLWTRTDIAANSGIVDIGFHYNDTSSAPEGQLLVVPSVYSTIQQAIDAANYNDTVLVAPGSYTENIDFKGKAIVVKADQGPTVTTIDGAQNGSTVTFNTGEIGNSVIEGFTITNGSGTDIGGELFGGGVICNYYVTNTIDNCVIFENSADNGGGISVYERSCPTITNSSIIDNKASVYGGGMRIEDYSRPFITNCLVIWNSAERSGGIEFYNRSNCEIHNVTVANNLSRTEGGGVSTITNTYCHFYDSIVRDNIGLKYKNEQVYEYSYADCNFHYSNVSQTVPGNDNINSNPFFVDPNTGDYHLKQDPCQPGVANPSVDSGSDLATTLYMDTVWTRTDKVCDSGQVDMGFHYNDETFYPGGNVLKVPSAYPSIQQAIDAASYGDIVEVAAGTYLENIKFNGKAIKVLSEQGPSLTTIDGAQAGTVVSFDDSEMRNSILDGFTITNGTGTDIGGTYYGGGVLCGPYSHPAIRNCIISANSADYGGGVCSYDHSCVFVDFSIIRANNATNNGGGFYIDDYSNSLITNCIIDWNTADISAGMEFHTRSNGLSSNLTIVNNTAVTSGGGYSATDHSTPFCRNSILWGNLGGIYPEIYKSGYSSANYSTCVVGLPSISGKNINEDPLFVNMANSDYHLSWNSSCINMCDDSYVSDVDFDGVPRFFMGTSDIGVYEYTGAHTMSADSFSIPGGVGGTVNFTLDAGPAYANNKYIILASLSGNAPGIPLPKSNAAVYINWDFFTTMVVQMSNLPTFANFTGVLNGVGQKTATLLVPFAIPDAIGLTMSFAFTVKPFGFGSNPINVKIVP